MQYLFKKLQTSLFERDNTFKETSNEINSRIANTTGDLFKEFKDKTGIDAEFSIPESLIDFFTTINVSTENGVSLYSRGDGIQARFIPAILNEISKGNKYTLWGFEEPENSFEYRNAELLAEDFLNTYSETKQIFITSHTKEFLSLIKGNEDRVSLHRVYKTLEKGSLIDTYRKGIGFDKQEIQESFWGGVQEKNKKQEDKDILNKIFEDIGFLESDQFVIEELQNQLKTQRRILEKSGLKISEQERINKQLTKRLQATILNKEALEREIEEYKKPILYVEDKYDQIYKIAYLKLNKIDCNMDNYESQFKENAPFVIRRTEGAGKLQGRLNSANNDGYEEKKMIGLFDFDKEGREKIDRLDESLWKKEYHGEIKSGYYKKRKDHCCFYAMLLPIPDELIHLANLEWDNFMSFVQIENLLPIHFLEKNHLIDKTAYPGGVYLKIKKDKKDRLWKKLFDLQSENFIHFKPIFTKINELFSLG